MRYVLPLSAVGVGDAGQVGRKAAVLGELRAAGFPVPDGFAVTVEAFDHAAGSVRPPAGLVDELRRALAALGHAGSVAVRSSGLAEDLAGKSYAGQYESALGVRGLDHVVEAVRACWASVCAERVTTYRNGTGGQVRMGVLVQVMVDPTVAGVAFSSNPVTGDGAEALVSAIDGLGDRLAAGEVDAEEWAVRGDTARPTAIRSATAAVLGVDQARAVARLARRVAGHFAAPQDIEWALVGGTLWLLQARPITALPRPPVEPVPIEIEVPPGYSTRNRSMDRPWTPMERSVFLPVFSASVRHIFSYTTGIVPTAHSIGGWVYLTTPPDSTQEQAVRRERVAADLAKHRPHELIGCWHATWKPAYAKEIAALRDVDLADLTDAALDAHLRALVALFERLHDRYFRLTGAAIALAVELGATCTELLGWSGPQITQLRGGLVGAHMAATVRLSELARLATERPAVRRLLERQDVDPEQLAVADPDFAAAFADYVRQYAHRTIGFDLTEPTLAEQPAVLLALIRAQLAKPYDFAAERAAVGARIAAALAEARTALSSRPAADRARFEAAFAASEQSAPVRDEKVFFAVSLWALLRYSALELGRRLVARGLADRADDALFLELPQALSALSGGGDQRDSIRLHRGQHAWAAANPGPPAYGQPHTPPPGDAGPPLSPEAQRTMRVAESAMHLMTGSHQASEVDGQLRGLAASPGRYLGPVRVIHNVTEFGKLRNGDVLVCPETTAQWSVLFPSVGALVTDRGSLLSHPAILAREYGVPAVVATGAATCVLRDDQLVVVDGATGVVRPAPDPVAST
jgi:phosphohistidine swiveling domain-containing protein